MGIVSYSLFAYGVTAVISLAVAGIIVIVSKITNKPENVSDKEDENNG